MQSLKKSSIILIKKDFVFITGKYFGKSNPSRTLKSTVVGILFLGRNVIWEPRLPNRTAQKTSTHLILMKSMARLIFRCVPLPPPPEEGVIQLHLRFRAWLDSNPIKVKVKLSAICLVEEGREKIDLIWKSNDRHGLIEVSHSALAFLHDLSPLHHGYISTWLKCQKLEKLVIGHQPPWLLTTSHSKLFSRLQAKVTKWQKYRLQKASQSMSCHLRLLLSS